MAKSGGARRRTLKHQADALLQERLSKLTEEEVSLRESELQSLEQGLRREIQPEGVVEEAVFQQALRAMRGIRRIQYLQQAMNTGDADLLNRVTIAVLERLDRHYSSYNKSLERAMRELQVLQKHRRQWTELLQSHYRLKAPLANAAMYRQMMDSRARVKVEPAITDAIAVEEYSAQGMAGRTDPATGKRKIWIN